MIFKKAQVTNVTANIGKGEIKLTFSVSVTEIQTAAELALYTDKENGKVTLEIMPWQPELLANLHGSKAEFIREVIEALSDDVHEESAGEWREAGSVLGDPE